MAGRQINNEAITLDLIAQAIGWDATWVLALEFGGQEIYVPSKITPAHKVARVIGFDNAAVLAAEIGNNRVTFPVAARREARIRLLANAKPRPTNNDIAKQVGCSHRFVQKIVAGSPAQHKSQRSIARALAEARQPQLF